MGRAFCFLESRAAFGGRKKQVPPLRRRLRSGSGRNDKVLGCVCSGSGRNDKVLGCVCSGSGRNDKVLGCVCSGSGRNDKVWGRAA
jgi:hypothetical protein